MWTVKPLQGKYYGTIVQYNGCDVCKFWESNHFATPFGSSREIARGFCMDWRFLAINPSLFHG